MKKQFAKFVVVGVYSTLINYGVFYLLFSLGIHYLVASATGFVTGVFSGYFANKHWTFESGHQSNRLAVKYGTVYIVSLCLSLVFLKVTVDEMGVDARIANILSIGIATVTNFIGSKYWVFRK